MVSSSQIIANDLYRRTFVPMFHPDIDPERLDRRILLISRVSTVAVLLICMIMAWSLMDVNVSLIVWIGVGGMMAAFAGPLVVGALWRGRDVSRRDRGTAWRFCGVYRGTRPTD